MITDRELALMKAKADVFPNATLVLCNWHIQKNVLKKCKGKFDTAEEWEVFAADWANIERATTVDAFNE